MEKHLKKAKITLPKIEKKTLSNKWRLLMLSATIIDIAAFFSPLLWQQYTFILLPQIYPYPNVPRESWFWSFMAIFHMANGGYKFSVFWNYWFDADGFHFGGTGWLFIFVFQVSTIVTALLTFFDKIRSKRLGNLLMAILSTAVLTLCLHQMFVQQSYFWSNSQLSIGFWLNIASTLLSSISFLKAKI